MSDKPELELINTIFVKYKQRFIFFANSYIHDMCAAEDITIDAITYYWEHKDQLRHEDNIPAYILTVIKNKCLNYLQHQQVVQEHSEKMLSDAQWDISMRISSLQDCEPYDLITNEMMDIVNKTLSTLPEQTKRIFEMSRFENMTNKEIAAERNISVKGVEFHISKALTALRVALKDYKSFLFSSLF